jgi:uncharacterized membrane protein YqgA involved in biofilm formation
VPKIAGIGTLVNAAAILAGTALGYLSGRLIPERVRKTAMAAMGLTIFFLGMQMALDPRVDPARLRYTGPLPYHPNPLIIIGGLVLGSVLGEFMQLEDRLERFGTRLQQWASALSPAGAGEGHSLVEGFVTATLMFCIGAMAVIGPIQDAAGQPHVMYVKAMIDGVCSVMLASALGLGVALSALPVLAYQGGITLAAERVTPLLTLPVLTMLTATGGLLIAAIGLDVAGIRRLPVGNMLPGVFVASILAYFLG